MEVPDSLLAQIRDGKVVLYLGAGASIGATSAKGEPPPTGRELAQRLADKFLGGTLRDSPLHTVSELAISETDFLTVQDYIRSIFEDIWPAPFHKLLPAFCWKGIATTNYDLVVERAYQSCKNPVQRVVPLIKNGDRVEDKIRSRKDLMLLKLHGCITRTTDVDVPLILTVDQYVTYYRGRERLFDHLKGWAYEHPIIFVGHSLADPDIRQILLQLASSEQRPRFYVVSPNVCGPEQRFWDGKRISTLAGTFEEFLRTLDDQINSAFRGVAVALPEPELPISERFLVPEPGVSTSAHEFLSASAEYVRHGIPSETVRPQDFYRGFLGGWSAIEQDLDVRRQLADSVLVDAVLADDAAEPSKCRLYVIKGPAGSGKSVLIRRVAWEAALSFGKLCLFVRPHARLSFDALREVSTLTNERVFLFLDEAADYVAGLYDLVNKARRAGLALTIVAAERNNEWNLSCDRLNPYVTEEFEVGYLTSKEVDGLLALLEKHRSLGTLSSKPYDERRTAFEERAGRQLLVALHEATLGKPFEDIIADEYADIRPESARFMYLGVCFLNRLSVPVRAGVIARVYGIRFVDFQDKFFKPLEKVVLVREDPRTRDYAYEARHAHIAQIVFERAMRSQEERLDIYLRFLRALNIDYDADRTAYRRLIRGRSLLELFPDYAMVQGIYRACEELAADDAYLFHQKAIYEMNRPSGNLEKAQRYLERAQQLAPRDRTIKHSVAEMSLRKAETASAPVAFEAYAREARRLATGLIQAQETEEHGFHTLAKIGLARLRRLLMRSDDEWNEIEVHDAIKEIEKALEGGLQRFPEEPYLLEAESELGSLLADEKRATEALWRAFRANPHSSYVAIRLAKLMIRLNRATEAVEIYKRALKAAPDDRKLHYNYAKLLLDTGSSEADTIEYHLRRAFTDGDKNYDAQFWYARQLYLNGKINDSKERFLALRDSPLDPAMKKKLRGAITIGDQTKVFAGRIIRLEPTYTLIARDGTGDIVFLHRSNVDNYAWNQLALNKRLRFSIGFTFSGAAAFDTELE